MKSKPFKSNPFGDIPWRWFLLATVLIVVGCFWSTLPGFCADQSKEISPRSNNGKKWRLAYVEAGPYQDSQGIFRATLDGLQELGWLKKLSYPDPIDERETRTLWSYLSSSNPSDYLEFVADAYWTAGWNEETRKQNREAIINRLNNTKDIDLLLVFGTKAALDMVNDLHSVPTMVFSVSDPIQAGIVKSVNDSGFDHVHVRVDPVRYERQVRLFWEIIRFKKLGMAYEDSPTGRSYAAIADVRKIAAEKGFEILECFTLGPDYSISQREESVIECSNKLAPQVDAFYITIQVGVNSKTLPKILEPLERNKVVTFAMGRTEQVRQGVLMSLAQESFKPLGRFHATTMARIFNGAKPRDLPQAFEDTQEIAINLDTAKRIGFRVPLDVLAGAKEVYEITEKVGASK